MILSNQIIKNIEKHSVVNNAFYKSRTTKFNGSIIECDSFPSPIGTVCEIECNDKTTITGEIIGFKENKNVIAVHSQNANIVLGSSINVLNASNSVNVGDDILGRVITLLVIQLMTMEKFLKMKLI